MKLIEKGLLGGGFEFQENLRQSLDQMLQNAASLYRETSKWQKNRVLSAFAQRRVGVGCGRPVSLVARLSTEARRLAATDGPGVALRFI